MSEEKKDIVDEEIKDDEKKQDDDEKKDDEKKDDEKEDFEKDSETVPSSKYNQELRKRREAEARIKELESRSDKDDDDDDEDEKDDDEKKDEKEVDPLRAEIDEIKNTLSRKDADERKRSRQSFFENHPEYLNDAEKWNELLEEIDNSFNPNSPDPYYTQLEKAHRIIADTPSSDAIDDKKREMANDTATGDDGESIKCGEEFTAEDKQIMKEQGVSEDAMRALKKKQESGRMVLL